MSSAQKPIPTRGQRIIADGRLGPPRADLPFIRRRGIEIIADQRAFGFGIDGEDVHAVAGVQERCIEDGVASCCGGSVRRQVLCDSLRFS